MEFDDDIQEFENKRKARLRQRVALGTLLLVLGISAIYGTGIFLQRKAADQAAKEAVTELNAKFEVFDACLRGSTAPGISLTDAILERMVHHQGWDHPSRDCFADARFYTPQQSRIRERYTQFIDLDRMWSDASHVLTEASFRPRGLEHAQAFCSEIKRVSATLGELAALVDAPGLEVTVDCQSSAPSLEQSSISEETWRRQFGHAIDWGLRDPNRAQVSIESDGTGLELTVSGERGGDRRELRARTTDGALWEVIPLGTDRWRVWEWADNHPWGMAQNPDTGTWEGRQYSDGEWHSLGSLAPRLVPRVAVRLESGQHIVLGFRRDERTGAHDIIRQALGSDPVTLGALDTLSVNCRSHIDQIGGITVPCWGGDALTITYAPIEASLETVTHHRIDLDASVPRAGRLGACSAGDAQWLLVADRQLIASSDSGQSWVTVEVFDPPVGGTLYCGGETLAIVDEPPVTSDPSGGLLVTTCSASSCNQAHVAGDIDIRGWSARLGEDGRTRLLMEPSHLTDVSVGYEQDTAGEFVLGEIYVRSGPEGVVRLNAWRIDGLWFIRTRTFAY